MMSSARRPALFCLALCLLHASPLGAEESSVDTSGMLHPEWPDFGSVWADNAPNDYSTADDKEHQAKIAYIREVFRQVPMMENLRRHIYETPDPFDFDIPNFSVDSLWREIELQILPDETETELFLDMVRSYLERRVSLASHGKAGVKSSSRPSPAPSTRAQIGGYEGCARDYNAYILPVTDNILRALILRWNAYFVKACSITFNPAVCEDRFIQEPPASANSPPWAARLLDSHGATPPTGVLPGKLHWVGTQEECSKSTIRYNYSTPTDVEQRTFDGYYCRLNLSHKTRNSTIYPLQFGMCFPDTCTKENISYYLEEENNVTQLILRLLRRNITVVYCGLDPDISTDIYGKIAFGLTFAIVGVVIVATCYDGWGRKNYVLRQIRKRVATPHDIVRQGKRPNHDVRGRWGIRPGRGLRSLLAQKPTFADRMEVCWVGFSMYSNIRHMFSTETRSDRVRSLDGLRTLALLWLISGMTWVFSIVYFESWTTHNLLQAATTFPKEWRFMTTLGVYHCHDLFLVVSGAACVLAYYRKWEENDRKMTVWFFFRFFLNRYWFFMPAFMLALNLYMNGYEYLGDGPLNPHVNSDGKNCETTWWVVLLQLHNVVKTDQQCFGWSWGFAMIFQLNIASFAVLIPLMLVPVLGYVVIVAFFIVGIVTSAIYNMKAREGEAGWYIDVLQAPWCNAGQYAIGLALGVLLHKKKGKAKMHPAGITCLWLLAITAALAAIYTPFDKFKENGNTWSDDAQTAYSVLAPIGMSLSMCWVIFACEAGWGGIVQQILRWRFFTAFSHYVFTTGLMMGALMSSNIYGMKDLVYITENDMTAIKRGDIMLLLLYGFIINLICHYPWSVGIRVACRSQTLYEAFRYGNHPEVIDSMGDEDGLGDDIYDDVSDTLKDNLPLGGDVIREVKGLDDHSRHPPDYDNHRHFDKFDPPLAMANLYDRL